MLGMPGYFNNRKITKITNYTFRPYRKKIPIIAIDDKNLTPPLD